MASQPGEMMIRTATGRMVLATVSGEGWDCPDDRQTAIFLNTAYPTARSSADGDGVCAAFPVAVNDLPAFFDVIVVTRPTPDDSPEIPERVY